MVKKQSIISDAQSIHAFDLLADSKTSMINVYQEIAQKSKDKFEDFTLLQARIAKLQTTLLVVDSSNIYKLYLHGEVILKYQPKIPLQVSCQMAKHVLQDFRTPKATLSMNNGGVVRVDVVPVIRNPLICNILSLLRHTLSQKLYNALLSDILTHCIDLSQFKPLNAGRNGSFGRKTKTEEFNDLVCYFILLLKLCNKQDCGENLEEMRASPGYKKIKGNPIVESLKNTDKEYHWQKLLNSNFNVNGNRASRFRKLFVKRVKKSPF